MSGFFRPSDDDPFAILDGRGIGSAGVGGRRRWVEPEPEPWVDGSFPTSDDFDEGTGGRTRESGGPGAVADALQNLCDGGYEVHVLVRSIDLTEFRVVRSDQVFVVICRGEFPDRAPSIYMPWDGAEVKVDFDWDPKTGLIPVMDRLFEEYRAPEQVAPPQEIEESQVDSDPLRTEDDESAPGNQPYPGDTNSPSEDDRLPDVAVGDPVSALEVSEREVPLTIPPEPEGKEGIPRSFLECPGWSQEQLVFACFFSKR